GGGACSGRSRCRPTWSDRGWMPTTSASRGSARTGQSPTTPPTRAAPGIGVSNSGCCSAPADTRRPHGSHTQGTHRMSTNLKTLIGKLNAPCREAAERAANLCLARGNYEVDLEHLFLALLEQAQSDVVVVARRSGLGVDALRQDLEAEVARFRSGNTRTPVFSPHLPTLFEHAWLLASLDTQTTRIRSGHLLLALLTEPGLAQLATRGSAGFAKIRLDE